MFIIKDFIYENFCNDYGKINNIFYYLRSYLFLFDFRFLY